MDTITSDVVELCGSYFAKQGSSCIQIVPKDYPEFNQVSQYTRQIQSFTLMAAMGICFGLAASMRLRRDTVGPVSSPILKSHYIRLSTLLLSILASSSLAIAVTGYATLAPRKVGRGHNEMDPSLFPRLDQSVAMMDAPAPILDDTFAAAFDSPVPRSIHQIWLGESSGIAGRDQRWRDYANKFDYDYHLWTEKDFDSLPMTVNNRRIFDFELKDKKFKTASDIARLEILLAQGGIYVDMDFRPPTRAGAWIPMDEVLPMRHFGLMTEPFARDVGAQTGIFTANGFLVAAVNHPMIRHLRDGLARNWFNANRGHRGPVEYSTGPFYLNRLLRGSPNVLLFPDAEVLGMLEW